jgi:hypothetical protein
MFIIKIFYIIICILRMFIHKSFSVSELIDIIEIFEMDIPDYYDYYKKGLIFYIEVYIQNHRYVNFDNIYFDFTTYYELVSYLNSPNIKFKISIERKKEINTMANTVLKYCKEYRVDDFQYHFDLIESLSLYGDLCSVRKAIIAINRYDNKPYTIKFQNSVFYLKHVKEKKYLKNKFESFKYHNDIQIINFN